MAEPTVRVRSYARRVIDGQIVEVRPGQEITPELARAMGLLPEVRSPSPAPDTRPPAGWPVQRKETHQ